jgi:molybdenum cofactor synthesis domain-containing protein
MRAAVITVSTSRAAGRAEDEGGDRLEALAGSLGAEVIARELVTDRRDEIAAVLRRCADELDCDLILTTGGTGFAPDDVTPEATRDVLEREAPGIAEALRLESRPHTRKWMVSRGVAGTRGRSLIVNLPGNPPSIDQVADVLREAVPHAVSLLRGEKPAHHHR